MSDFFSMDGYGIFLWPCYLITFVAIVANVLIARRAHENARVEALRRIDHESAEEQA